MLVCEIDPGSGLCLGCLRTLDEIAGWSRLTERQREAVMLDLPKRRIDPGPGPTAPSP